MLGFIVFHFQTFNQTWKEGHLKILQEFAYLAMRFQPSLAESQLY